MAGGIPEAGEPEWQRWLGIPRGEQTSAWVLWGGLVFPYNAWGREGEILICLHRKDPTFTPGWCNLGSMVIFIQKKKILNKIKRQTGRYACICTHTPEFCLFVYKFNACGHFLLPWVTELFEKVQKKLLAVVVISLVHLNGEPHERAFQERTTWSKPLGLSS